MIVYCLFCETEKCHYVAQAVTQMFGCRAISPRQIQHTWSKGHPVDIEHDLLPGYVFVYCEAPMENPQDMRKIHGVIRCLSAGERNFELRGDDRQFALMLLEKDGVIGKTKVCEEGQMIRLQQGAFAGVQARILKVNRRNSRMLIEIPFVHQNVKTWVEYELVEPEQCGLQG